MGEIWWDVTHFVGTHHRWCACSKIELNVSWLLGTRCETTAQISWLPAPAIKLLIPIPFAVAELTASSLCLTQVWSLFLSSACSVWLFWFFLGEEEDDGDEDDNTVPSIKAYFTCYNLYHPFSLVHDIDDQNSYPSATATLTCHPWIWRSHCGGRRFAFDRKGAVDLKWDV